jgi:hypothetical protein
MKNIFRLLFILMLVLSFNACGGGGGGGNDSPSATPLDTSTYSIKGTITVNGNALGNINVELSGDSTLSRTTASDGSYTFSELGDGDYIVTPSTAAGYIFDPVNREVTINGRDVTSMDFAATPSATSTYSIKGTITVNGNALGNITVELSGDSTVSTITTSDGSYKFWGLGDGDYTLTPSTATGNIFDPVNRAVTINGADVTSMDFAATKICAPDAPSFLHYTLPDQYQYEQDGLPVANEAAALFSGYTPTSGILYKGELVSGYSLDQFVDKAAVNAATPDPVGALRTNDARGLYSVLVRSNQDGFSIRTHFLSLGIYTVDLRWDQFILGYLLDLNYSGRVFYPASVGVVKKHTVKYAYDIYMFRKIDVKRPDAAGSLATFEVQATKDSYVDDSTYTSVTTLTTTKLNVATVSIGAYTDVKVIPLEQFLTDYVTDSPGNYTYKIVALDGTYKEGWTYAEMGQAYYLVDYDLIVQVDSSNNVISGTKINFPVRIELIGAAVAYDYSAKNPPAYAKAY